MKVRIIGYTVAAVIIIFAISATSWLIMNPLPYADVFEQGQVRKSEQYKIKVSGGLVRTEYLTTVDFYMFGIDYEYQFKSLRKYGEGAPVCLSLFVNFKAGFVTQVKDHYPGECVRR